MGLKLCSLSSGSTGNCIFVGGDKTALLIDCGISLSRVEKSLCLLSRKASEVNVLVTHCHHDHISGLKALSDKYSVPVHAHFLSSSVKTKVGKNKGFCEFGDGDFYVGDLLVSPFRVRHDVPTVGFNIYSADKKVSVLTDLGRMEKDVLTGISDSDIVLIECNHDEELLRNNPKYASFLKNRILSDRGHLSNSACADACVTLANGGVKQIILAHLSRENNYPELAFNTVRDRLLSNGIKEGEDIQIEVAPPHGMTGLYEVS